MSRTLLRSRGSGTVGLQGHGSQGSIVDNATEGRFLIGIPIEVKVNSKVSESSLKYSWIRAVKLAF